MGWRGEVRVRVGMEATGYDPAGSSGCWQSWVWNAGIGNAAEIKTQTRPRNRNRLGGRPTAAETAAGKELSARSGYRSKRSGIYGNCCGTGIEWVRMRTRIMNQLQALAMNEVPEAEEKAVERSRTTQESHARFLGLAALRRSLLRRWTGNSNRRSRN